LIELGRHAHHSIALTKLYQKSFETNLIQTNVWPQIALILKSTKRLRWLTRSNFVNFRLKNLPDHFEIKRKVAHFFKIYLTLEISW